MLVERVSVQNGIDTTWRCIPIEDSQVNSAPFQLAHQPEARSSRGWYLALRHLLESRRDFAPMTRMLDAPVGAKPSMREEKAKPECPLAGHTVPEHQ